MLNTYQVLVMTELVFGRLLYACICRFSCKAVTHGAQFI
jgi:hypothetical protein